MVMTDFFFFLTPSLCRFSLKHCPALYAALTTYTLSLLLSRCIVWVGFTQWVGWIYRDLWSCLVLFGFRKAGHI